MKRIFSLLALVIVAIPAFAKETIPATNHKIVIVGRHSTDNGALHFDWSGVQIKIQFKGSELAMKASDTGVNWLNVWVDKTPVAKEDMKIRTSTDSCYIIVSGLKKGEHSVVLQKRTEGEQGCICIESFITDGNFLQAEPGSDRRIEFIGDSYTCGYGTESGSRDDPFSVDTENCNLTYAEIIARYFEADAMHTSHSGRGLVRNYGGADCPTMLERYCQTFDEYSPASKWDFSKFIPDIVVVYLGTNDFSTGEKPEYERWKEATDMLVAKTRKAYGPKVPVLFVASKASDELGDYVRQATNGMDKVYWTSIQANAHNSEDELGASWHPNYKGHRKVASLMIPYISTLTGWEMPMKAYE